MMRTSLLAIILSLSALVASGQENDTALILIDIQEFYFDTTKSPLEGNVEAARQAGRLLEQFRNRHMTVIHVRHKGGGPIHEFVEPIGGEKVVVKEEVSCFNGTGLGDYLKDNNVRTLVIAGMMTHMCVEGATRAGYDLGFNCILVGDACATKNLTFDSEVVKARDVQLSTLNTLSVYSKVVTTDQFLNRDF